MNVDVIQSAATVYSGHVLKAYEPGTTTAISIATDKDGTNTYATLTTNSAGVFEVGGAEVVPYIDRAHKWALFANATDASNNTNPVLGFFDNVPFPLGTVKEYDILSDALGDSSLSTLIAGGGFIEVKGRVSKYDGAGNVYQVVSSGTGTADGGLYINDTINGSTFQLKGIFPDGRLTAEQFGAPASPTDASTHLQAALDAASTIGIEKVDLTRANYTSSAQLTVPQLVFLNSDKQGKSKITFSSDVTGVLLNGAGAGVSNRLQLQLDAGVSPRTGNGIQVGTTSPNVKANVCRISCNLQDWGDLTAKTGDGINIINGNFTRIEYANMENIGRDGLHVTQGSDTNAGLIDQCYVNICGRDAYHFEDSVAHWRGITADCIDFGRRGYHFGTNTRYIELEGDVESVGTQGGARGATTDATGYAIGVGTVTLAAAGVGLIQIGDTIKFKGDSTLYTITAGDTDVSDGGTISFTPTLAQAIPAAETEIIFWSTVSDWLDGAFCDEGANGHRASMFPVQSSSFATATERNRNTIYHVAGANPWRSSHGVQVFNDGFWITNQELSYNGELQFSHTGAGSYNITAGGYGGSNTITMTEGSSGTGLTVDVDGKIRTIPDGAIATANANSDDIQIHAATGGANAGISIITANTAQGAVRFADTDNDSAGSVVYDHSADTYTVECNDANSAQFDNDSTAGNTRFLLYDVNSGQLERVKVGANGTGPGGTGRALYIDNV